MKKNLVMSGLLLVLGGSLYAQTKYTIKGNLSDLKEDKKVFLSYRNNGSRKEDSTIAKKGVFTFSGTLSEPTRATLLVKPMQRDTSEMTYEKFMAQDKQDFFMDNALITVKGDKTVKTASITGGVTQTEYKTLQAALKPYQDKMTPLTQQIRQLPRGNNPAVDSLAAQLNALRKEMRTIEENFIRTNNSSYVSMDLLQERSFVIELEEFEPLFNALSAELKNKPAGQKLAGKIELTKKTSVGKPAMDFTQQNTQEKPFSLASLKGKYVLIDFWASWCGPCRMENPNVVKAYNAFKDKNFEIVGVSLDDQKQPWLDAIKKDGLPWVHVSDLKGWKNEVAVQYGISAVPQNFLLDPNGVIIAKNLRGEELSKKLEELIK